MRRLAPTIYLGGLAMAYAQPPAAEGQYVAPVQNTAGMQLLVVDENTEPALRIVLPGHASSDRSIEVLFPEHITGVKHGSAIAEHLYLFRPGRRETGPSWRRIGRALEYERDLPGHVHFLARAMLEDDGVRFHYEFANHSAVAYDMIYAVTDPRLTSTFHDVRLERTYVHHAEGFDLLASETPSRVTMPLDQWFPARYIALFTWPISPQRIVRRDDGITYYYKSRRVDEPVIATMSTDRKWVVASFAREPGSVWSNPELTCQHVDPQTSLGAGQRATLEVKMLVIQGSLNDVLQRVRKQRQTLR